MNELFGPLEQAVYATVHDYVDRSGQRGAVALAPRIGMSPGTLSNKASPQMQTHKLGLGESVPLQLQANDFRILYAYNLVLEHVAYQLPKADADACDIELLTHYTDFHASVGKKAEAIRRALTDKRFTKAEALEIRQLFDQMVRCGLGLMTRIESLAADD